MVLAARPAGTRVLAINRVTKPVGPVRIGLASGTVHRFAQHELLRG